MDRSRHRASSAILIGAFALSSCSGAGGPVSLPSSMSPALAQHVGVAKSARVFYVVNAPYNHAPDGYVTVYSNDKLLRKLKPAALPEFEHSLGVDRTGKLYVASEKSEAVIVYAPLGGRISRTITQGIDDPLAMQLSDAGALYVANFRGNNVTVYAAGSNKVSRTISKDVGQPQGLALGLGQLFVFSSSVGGSKVNVYAAGTKGPDKVLRTISNGVSGPLAIAFDDGNLYVANSNNTVTVYAKGMPTLTRTISQGIEQPKALAFDRFHNLFVLNARGNSVTIYAKGMEALTGTIANVISPGGIALAADGTLYVSSRAPSGGVGAYKTTATGGTLIQTVTNGMSYPSTLAVGP